MAPRLAKDFHPSASLLTWSGEPMATHRATAVEPTPGMSNLSNVGPMHNDLLVVAKVHQEHCRPLRRFDK